MKNITLVILAAGMGSRFGGLKQIEPMGPNGEFIIDYSIYDAIIAGFNKVVFLIKEENFEIFKKTIGKRVENHIKVEYVFQKNDNLPKKYENLKDREKPLGTAHAILCCKDIVKEPFMIINADDFYGSDAFAKGAEFLKNMHDETPHVYGMIGYIAKNTLTENGAVKRGICQVENGLLTKLTESSVEKINEKIYATPLDNKLENFEVKENDMVSMNMLLFDGSIFKYLEENFELFLNENNDKLNTFEYLIPDVLFKAIEEKYAICKVIPTVSTWYGVTYKEDKEAVKNSIKKLVKTMNNKEGKYPNNLWN